MAIDATGTPTSLGIPKFNTAVDAPSGKGSNAQMDSIDTLLVARIVKPAGILAGEGPVWDGAAFARSSVTKLASGNFGPVVNADVSAGAAIAYSKLALTGLIVNADIGAAAAIAYSKLALTGSVVNTDVGAAAAIAYSKLSLAGSIVNADIGAAAAIAKTKLAALAIADADVAAGAAIGIAKLAGYPTDATKFLRGDATWAVPAGGVGVGAEQAYNEFTANSGTGAATTEGTAATVVTATAFTADGASAYLIHAYIPYAEDWGSNNIIFVLYLDGVSVGKWGEYKGTGYDRRPVHLSRRTIPASGSRTYSLRAYNVAAANNAVFAAGAGGSGNYMPGFIRITKVT